MKKNLFACMALLAASITSSVFSQNIGSTTANKSTLTSPVWALTGNAGTNANINFLGTTDAQDMVIRVHNKERLRITQNGALYLNGKGRNMFVGDSAGYSNTTGHSNYFSGYKAGYSNTEGDDNHFSGYEAGYSNVGITSSNFFIGYKAGHSNTIGYANFFSGNQAGYSNTNGKVNYFSGYNAGYSNINGNANQFIGYLAGYSNINGLNNQFIGFNAGYSNTSGNDNYFSGFEAGYSNTTGFYNYFSGDHAGHFNINGEGNQFIGYQAGFSNTKGSVNYFSGFGAGYSNKSGYRNHFEGYQAGYSNYGGDDNQFIGFWAGYNSYGNENQFIGHLAGYYNTSGSKNDFSGYHAGYSNTTGHSNYFSGYNAGDSNITGSLNTVVGNRANVGSPDLTNASAFGYRAHVNASNTIKLGNANVTVVESHGVFATSSDGRFKKDVTEDVRGLPFILHLRPVVCNFEAEKMDNFLEENNSSTIDSSGTPDPKLDYRETESIRQSGFIAQEVEKAAKDCGYNFNGIIAPKNDKQTYSLAYAQFVVPLVKAVQELSKQNDSLRQTNTAIQSDNALLHQQLNDINSKINQIENAMSQCCSSFSSNIKLTNQLINQSGKTSDQPKLEQNIPNPFNHTTTINYTLPQTYSSAKIIITDKNDKTLKEVNVSGSGKRSLSIDASAFASGVYQYSLYANGKLIDAKQMILTK